MGLLALPSLECKIHSDQGSSETQVSAPYPLDTSQGLKCSGHLGLPVSHRAGGRGCSLNPMHIFLSSIQLLGLLLRLDHSTRRGGALPYTLLNPSKCSINT